jgi:hypothetical protein
VKVTTVENKDEFAAVTRGISRRPSNVHARTVRGDDRDGISLRTERAALAAEVRTAFPRPCPW